MSIGKIIKWGFLLAFVIGAVVLWFGYKSIYQPNVPDLEKETSIEVPRKSSFHDVMQILVDKELLMDTTSFKMVSKLMRYDRKLVPNGKFAIQPNWNNRELITALRAGLQKPINLTFNNIRYSHELAGQVSKYIEPDSLEIWEYLQDSDLMEKKDLSSENLLTMFIPNTYEFYWNTTAEQFVKRMEQEHAKFWKNGKRSKALKTLGLKKEEVYTLASIVEKESRLNSEKPTIAGVYINRLNQGIKLQADPTVVYGVGDFTIRRVLNKHLAHVSPYNTYLNEGLPPGPICMPSISSIDAVLNYDEHDYLFFCAKPGYNGAHLFAETNAQHSANARKFHAWLDSEKIKK